MTVSELLQTLPTTFTGPGGSFIEWDYSYETRNGTICFSDSFSHSSALLRYNLCGKIHAMSDQMVGQLDSCMLVYAEMWLQQDVALHKQP